MRLLYGVYLLLSVASATDVRITFIQDIEKNASSLIAYGASGDLITRICGTTIKAKESIDFSNINENGVGNFTVGSTSFFVHSDPKYSGGPSCSTDFDHPYTAIQCSGVKWDPEGVVKQDKKSCFFENLAGTGFEDYQTDPRYHKLQRRCGKKKPRLDGDGWPHQRYYYEQLSEVGHCSKTQGCSVSTTNTKSISKTYSATINLPIWISGGYNVAKSWAFGASYSCNGGAGDTVCVWYKVAHTAYRVRMPKGLTEKDMHGPQIVIASPNKENKGGGFQCATGKNCVYKGATYWDCHGGKSKEFMHCGPPEQPELDFRDNFIEPFATKWRRKQAKKNNVKVKDPDVEKTMEDIMTKKKTKAEKEMDDV
ncbi:hypothetical protein H9Q69_004333 [Fusarium xylarioides]|uniref:Uncharacterized protein n=1 Tax=Fusarium xylarioides TaxID=221167 RepID=A0A9P7KZC7_9HYPO|nr:hypothetical protein H9Q70_009339 [Fusarium xylarioides]KAG5758268.1 hypothetical protein H9Q72_013598 [Fusarium xylarioides]KAG5767489.1 hypothetical protein H9Q73_014195 [Fusarium xylarioides]KAG5796642.1 hypothetical protein H9Q69_004333 [Fusarium xylarioides]